MNSKSKKCVVCSQSLAGKQRRFCGRTCKNQHTNHRLQSYRSQQQRGRERKRRLVAMKGAKCSNCGYSRNLAALEFHHTDPAEKSFQLDLRSLSNRSWSRIEIEAGKCVLLCANCHTELHNPEFDFKTAW